jgi:hypothetical protein
LADHSAAARLDDLAEIVSHLMTEGIVRNQQEPALAALRDHGTGCADRLGICIERRVKARAALLRFSRSENREARQLFERALRLDPNYATAYAWLGQAYFDVAAFGWTEFPDDMLARAEEVGRNVPCGGFLAWWRRRQRTA